jgi:hypothetical protein
LHPLATENVVVPFVVGRSDRVVLRKRYYVHDRRLISLTFLHYISSLPLSRFFLLDKVFYSAESRISGAPLDFFILFFVTAPFFAAVSPARSFFLETFPNNVTKIRG